MQTADDSSKTAHIDAEALRLTKWKQEPTVRDLEKDLEAAMPAHQAHVGEVRTWLDNLHVKGSAVPKKPRKGRSKVQPKLIRKQAEWRYAALSEPFLSNPEVFQVSPVTFEDVAASRQAQLLLNHQFNTRIDKVGFIDEYVRTVVDEGSAVLRVGWEYEEDTVIEEVPVFEYRPNVDMLGQMNQLTEAMEVDPESYAQIPPELAKAHKMFLQDGIPRLPEQVGFEEVEKTVVLKNHPTVEVCHYERVVIDPSCHGDLNKANFIIFEFDTSRAELRKDGRYKNLEYVRPSDSSISKLSDEEVMNDAANFNFDDDERKIITAREYWGYRDIDGSGILTPVVMTWVGDVMVRAEVSPFRDVGLPFIGVHYMPRRKNVYGEPDGELLVDNQKIAGAVTRGIVDIMAKSANGQRGIRQDMLDPVNRRRFERGEDYEFNMNVDPNMGVFHHKFGEIPNSAEYVLQMTNNEAESMSGVKSFTSGISGAALGETATGVRGALDAASKRELSILRRLAKGITELGRKFLAMNAMFLDEEEVVRVTNEEFVPVDRNDLQGKFDLRLSISTAEEDQAKAEEISFMLQTMGNTAPPEVWTKLMAQLFRLRKMPDLAKEMEEYQPQPDPIEEQRRQLELRLLEVQLRNAELEGIGTQAQAEYDLARAEKARSEADLNDLEFVEQESGVKQERELQKQGEQARGNARLEAVKARLEMMKPQATEKK